MSVMFHLAFPIYDMQKAKYFYKDMLGCEVGRASNYAMIFNLGGHQIVAHKVYEQPPKQSTIYPRHFGLIYKDKSAFHAFIDTLNARGVSFEIPLKTRFPNTEIEHESFFLLDPSNNLLEFKHYTHPSAIFGGQVFASVGEAPSRES
jgi:uncharacterized protein